MKKTFGYKISKPTIHTWQDYLDFYKIWKSGISQLNCEIRKSKNLIKNRQRANLPTSLLQRKLVFRRIMARKMYQLLEEARIDGKQRRESELALKQELKQYPIKISNCRDVIFHFNKGFLFNPAIPMWVLKTKGKTYYVNHVDTNGVPFSTKETPEHNSTKGSIKFKNVDLEIDKDANAYLTGF